MKNFRRVAPLLILVACGDDETGPGGAGGASTTVSAAGPTTSSPASGTGASTVTTSGATSASSTSGTGGAASCREPGADDRDRFMVVGYGSSVGGMKSKQYGVLRVSTAGDVTVQGPQFELGNTTDRPIAFTPDGQIGMSINEEGTLGVFTLDAAGAVTVVNPQLAGEFYADNVVVAPDGSYALVLDPNTTANGGGLYRIDIACDGTLTDQGKVLEANTPHGLVFLDDRRVLLAATLVPGSAAADSVVMLDVSGPTPTFVAGVDAFEDADAMTSWLTLTHDKKFALVGNNSFFSANNSIGVVSVGDATLASAQIFDGLEDPFSIAASPFDNAALYVSGFGDAMFAMTYAPAAAMPFTIGAAIDDPGAQLPGALTTIERGSLAGRVFVSDVRGLYQLQFTAAGGVDVVGLVELSPMNAGTSVRNIGIQP